MIDSTIPHVGPATSSSSSRDLDWFPKTEVTQKTLKRSLIRSKLRSRLESMVVSGSLNRWWVPCNPPIGRKNTTYIPLIVLANWVIIWYRSHLLREPGFTPLIEEPDFLFVAFGSKKPDRWWHQDWCAHRCNSDFFWRSIVMVPSVGPYNRCE